MQSRKSLSIKTFTRYGAGCLLVFLLGMASCTKTTGPVHVVAISPLQTLVNADSNLSFFHRLIIQSNETGLLADRSVTLLIPDNAAFLASGYSRGFIDSIQSSQANQLIRYLFLPAAVNIPVANISAYAPYNTLLGNPLYGMSDGSTVWFNGVRALLDTARTGQALVYRLDHVLPASSDSLNHFLDGDSALSFMAEAFRRTHLYDTLLLAGGHYTILAPVNSAFQHAGYDSVSKIDSAYLARLVNYHTAPGLYFTNTLMTQNSLMTRESGTISVSSSNGVLQFKGANSTVPALFLTGNNVAGTTIVVQRISELLLP